MLRYSDTFLVTSPPKSNYDLLPLIIVEHLYLVIQFANSDEATSNPSIWEQEDTVGEHHSIARE